VPRLLQERVRATLLADGRRRTVAGVHFRVVAERKEHPTYGLNQCHVVAPRQVGTPDRSGKERIADEQLLANRSSSSNLQAHASRAVAWRVVRLRAEVAERDDLSGRIEHVHRRRRLDAQPEHRSLTDGILVEKQIVAMEIDGHAQSPLRRGDTRDVVHVRMREQDVTNDQRATLGDPQQPVDFVAGVDADGLPGFLAAEDEAIREKWSDRLSLNYHGTVILAVVDDLMFTSKIKNAAGQLGVPLSFARSSSSALEQMRHSAPALVIFDLNSARTDPLGTVAAMKRDPALASIPTVGFVSHVQVDLIDAARQAGIDDVMARSAFTARLGEILAGRP
jgi:CheY-like chemotaxis protein